MRRPRAPRASSTRRRRRAWPRSCGASAPRARAAAARQPRRGLAATQPTPGTRKTRGSGDSIASPPAAWRSKNAAYHASNAAISASGSSPRRHERTPIRSMWSGVLRTAATSAASARPARSRCPASTASTCRRSRETRPRNRARNSLSLAASAAGGDGTDRSPPRCCVYSRARATSSSVDPYEASCVSPHVTSPWCASTTARRSASSATRHESSNPGRMYSTTATSSPSASRTAAPGSGALASAQIASAWTWSTCAAGRNACRSVSTEGRGASGSTTQRARYASISSSVIASRPRSGRSSSSHSPGKSRASAVARSTPLPLIRRTRRSRPRWSRSTTLRRGVPAAVEDERGVRADQPRSGDEPLELGLARDRWHHRHPNRPRRFAPAASDG